MCPDSHVERVRQIQSEASDGLHILVVGYSGLDQEVLKLLAWGGRPLRSIRVVNGSQELSMNTVQAFAEHLGFHPSEDMAFPGTFTEFAQSAALGDFIGAAE